MPRSPWIASAACMKIAGVPVELRLATIFAPIAALLPIPVITTRPFDSEILMAAFAKLSSM